MMSRRKKIAIGFVALILIFFTALFVLVKIMVTPDRVRETLVPLVESSLQRKLQLGDIEISLFSGIVVHDLVLSDRETGAKFVAVDQAVLRYRFWPLLMMKVEVDELSLVKPDIHLTRFADGTFNFSDLSEPEVESDSQKAEQMASSEKDKGSTPVGVYVSKIVVRDGTLTFLDKSAKKEEQHVFSSLDLQVKDFSLTETFQASLSALWNMNELALDGDFDLDDRSANATARLNQIQAKLRGDLLANAKGDRLRVEISLPMTQVSAIRDSIPKEILSIPDTSGVTGQVAAGIVLDGLISDPDNLLKTGRIELDSIAAATQFTRNTLNGTIVLERKALKTENLSLSINDQLFDVDVGIEELLRQPLKVELAMHAARIDLDSFIPSTKEGTQADSAATPDSRSPSASDIQQAEEIGPYQLPLELRGTIGIDELLYHGLLMQQFAVELGIKNNILTIKRLTMDVAEGRLEQTGSVDLGVQGFQYSNQSKLKGVKINPVVKALMPAYSKSIFGFVDGQISMRGAGMVETTLKNNLQGSGTFFLKQGNITQMPALNSAATLLNMPDLKSIVIDNGQVAIQVKRGLVNLDIGLNGPLLKQTTTGTVSLDGQLGLKALLSLSPPLSQKLDKKGLLRNVLVGKDGWSRVPLVVKGDHVDPVVKLDMQVLKKQAAQGALDSLADRLLKKAGDNKKAEDESKDDQTRKLIDGALKGLFGN